MRVVHLFAHAPGWRHPWAAAAREVVDVVTVRTTSAHVPGGFERIDDTDYLIEQVKVNPETLTAPFVAHLMTRRYAGLLRVIAQDHGSVDLLHAHFYSAALHVAGLGLPYVVSEHTTVFTRRERPSVTRRSARAAQRVYDHASLVMPVSASLEADMRRAGIRARTRVIPNPIDVDVFSPATRSPSMEVVRVLAAQRLVQTKGFDILLRALFVARAADRRLVLRLAGAGPERPALERLVDILDLTDAVTFLGQIEPAALVKEMRDAHVFALPSRGDSFGLPVVEALSSGLPVVATPVGIVPDLLTSERGVVVPVDDIRALAAALLQVAADPESYPADVVSAGIRNRFSIPAVAQQLRDVYPRALTASGASSVDFG